jgi:hypothetical protein
MPTRARLPKATFLETLGVSLDVVVPNIAKGPINRVPGDERSAPLPPYAR